MVDGEQSYQVGVITRPSNEAVHYQAVTDFIDLLNPLVNEIHLATGKKTAEVSDLPQEQCYHLIKREYTGIKSIDYFLLQIYICLNVWRMLSDVELVFLHKGAMDYLLPATLIRATGTRVCAYKIGAYAINRDADPSVYDYIIYGLQYLTFAMATAVVVLGENEISSVPNDTVFVAHSRRFDLNTFDETRPLNERPIDIGFVGRFSEVKRIRQLAKATVTLCEEDDNFKACFIGSGPKKDEVASIVEGIPQIEVVDWVDHGDIPKYYRKMRFLFVPSVGEGLPTTVLEGMGCRTVIVASPVGSIPTVVQDGKTGFTIEDTTSCGIVERFHEIRDRDDIDEIASAGRTLVRREYADESIRTDLCEILRALNIV